MATSEVEWKVDATDRLAHAGQRSHLGTRRRVNLDGILIDRLEMAGVMEEVQMFLQSGHANYIVTVNLDFLSIARRDASFRTVLNAADLAVVDGTPLIWASRLLGQPLPSRITGHELLACCSELASSSGRSLFLVGAEPGIADLAGRRLKATYRNLSVAGTYSPDFSKPGESDRVIQMVNEARPDFLFVALGTPRQELWIHEHIDKLQVRVAVGVGCAFDVLAGAVNRAPEWMQHSGFEWKFRLAQEPSRLWRGYILDEYSYA